MSSGLADRHYRGIFFGPSVADRCSIWPRLAKEFQCGRVGERALPRGNSTAQQPRTLILMPPTHMCTSSSFFFFERDSSKQELSWRKWLFMTQMLTQEWAHLVIKRSHRNAQCPPVVPALRKPLSLFFSQSLLTLCLCLVVGNGAAVTDRPVRGGGGGGDGPGSLCKTVNIPPSEPPELPPSPPRRRWITATLERRFTFPALKRSRGAV